MRNYALILTLASVAVTACSDRPTATEVRAPTSPAFPPSAQNVEAIGTLIANPSRELAPYPFGLAVQDGSTWWLTGDQMAQLTSGSVVDARLDVRGHLDDNNGIVVESFLVLEVKGGPVSDGILEADGSTYALRLSGVNEVRSIVDPPDALKALVGARVWIAGTDDAAPTDFGIIVRNPELPQTTDGDYRIRQARPSVRRMVRR